MRVTGYKLRMAIREVTHTRDIAASQFDGSLQMFQGEQKETPERVMANYRKAEDTLAELQTAQCKYNLAVTVPVLDQKMTLCEAVKLVGGAGRAEKMWRSAAAGEKRDRWDRKDTRNKDEEYAVKTISTEVATALAKRAAKYASALREAIHVGNACEVEIEGLDPSLFE